MPLTYDRAFGGVDPASGETFRGNPAGRGFISRRTREAIHDRLLPNIEDVKEPITSWESRPKPAGFAFFGRGWVPRLGYAGTYDDTYQKERAPLLPSDFSYAFFNGAHPDLQVEGYLRGDEEVELRGVSPEGILRFRLPGTHPNTTVARWAVDFARWMEERVAVDPSITVEQVPVVEERVEAVLDTLVIVPDDRIFYEVFRAVFPLRGNDAGEIARVQIET
jgi:hypothetical protein